MASLNFVNNFFGGKLYLELLLKVPCMLTKHFKCSLRDLSHLESRKVTPEKLKNEKLFYQSILNRPNLLQLVDNYLK